MAHNNFNSTSGIEWFKPNSEDQIRGCGSPRDVFHNRNNADERYGNLYPSIQTQDSSYMPQPIPSNSNFSCTRPMLDGAFVDSQKTSLPMTFSSFASQGVQGPLPRFQPPLHPVYPSLVPPDSMPPFPPHPCMPPYLLPPTGSGYPLVSPMNFPHPPPWLTGENSNEKSIKKWLDTRKHPKNVEEVKKPSQKLNLKISDYKRNAAKLSELIGCLENSTTRLQVMSKSLNDNEWEVRKAEILNQKKLVQDAIERLKAIPEREILVLLKKRKSKRNRLRKKKEEWRELKRENKAICQLEHSRIDLWLEKMKGLVEKARRDEDIKKQADYILSEVFHKKSEAKRMLSLLTTLGKLRNARIHDRESKGEFVSKEAATTFNTIIENLKKRWMNQIKGYNIEEQGLRVMLTDAEVKRSNVELSLSKQIHQQWLELLFGNRTANSKFQASSLDQLVPIREDWDKFVVAGDFISSSIPIGWVVPVPPTSDAWASFIKK